MPEAESVTLLIDNREVVMTAPNHPWIFEAPYPANPAPGTGCVCSVAESPTEQHDPWAFRDEWMGEMDATSSPKETTITSGSGWELTSLNATVCVV